MQMWHYQLLAASSWVLANMALFPSTVQAFTRRRTTTDEWKAVLFFVGLILIAFPSRILFELETDETRQILYLCVVALAVLVLAMTWNGRKR